MLEILAQNVTNTGGTPPSPTFLQQLISFFPIILILGLFWFMMSNANRKRDRENKQMRENLKKGDRIQTVGGVLGTVVSVDGEEVVVKVDENTNTKIRFTRNAIHRVITDDAPATASKTDGK